MVRGIVGDGLDDLEGRSMVKGSPFVLCKATLREGLHNEGAGLVVDVTEGRRPVVTFHLRAWDRMQNEIKQQLEAYRRAKW